MMDFNGNQTIQGPKDSLSANSSNGFKQFQMLLRGNNVLPQTSSALSLSFCILVVFMHFYGAMVLMF